MKNCLLLLALCVVVCNASNTLNPPSQSAGGGAPLTWWQRKQEAEKLKAAFEDKLNEARKDGSVVVGRGPSGRSFTWKGQTYNEGLKSLGEAPERKCRDDGENGGLIAAFTPDLTKDVAAKKGSDGQFSVRACSSLAGKLQDAQKEIRDKAKLDAVTCGKETKFIVECEKAMDSELEFYNDIIERISAEVTQEEETLKAQDKKLTATGPDAIQPLEEQMLKKEMTKQRERIESTKVPLQTCKADQAKARDYRENCFKLHDWLPQRNSLDEIDTKEDSCVGNLKNREVWAFFRAWFEELGSNTAQHKVAHLDIDEKYDKVKEACSLIRAMSIRTRSEAIKCEAVGIDKVFNVAHKLFKIAVDQADQMQRACQSSESKFCSGMTWKALRLECKRLDGALAEQFFNKLVQEDWVEYISQKTRHHAGEWDKFMGHFAKKVQHIINAKQSSSKKK